MARNRRRGVWQDLFNHGVHVTGDSPNPDHGIEVNGGDLVPCPLMAGQADEGGDGIYDYGGRHVTYMLDAGYLVCMPTPAGTCEPVRSPASPRHDAGGAMCGRDRPARNGLARGTGALGGAPERGREIAQVPAHDGPRAARGREAGGRGLARGRPRRARDAGALPRDGRRRAARGREAS